MFSTEFQTEIKQKKDINSADSNMNSFMVVRVSHPISTHRSFLQISPMFFAVFSAQDTFGIPLQLVDVDVAALFPPWETRLI